MPECKFSFAGQTQKLLRRTFLENHFFFSRSVGDVALESRLFRDGDHHEQDLSHPGGWFLSFGSDSGRIHGRTGMYSELAFDGQDPYMCTVDG